MLFRSTANIPDTTLLFEGSVKYTVTGSKEFAVQLSSQGYLYVSHSINDRTVISLYNGTALKYSFEFNDQTTNTLYVSVLANGSVIVKINNGEYVGMGKLETSPSMIKFVPLGGNGIIAFTAVELDMYSYKGDVVPEYTSNDKIDFTAYGFDTSALVSDAGFSQLKEAGFTKVLALYQGRKGYEGNAITEEQAKELMDEVNADAETALVLAEEYGIEYYVFNEIIYNLERTTANYGMMEYFKQNATYTLSEAFAGHFLADEPNWSYNASTGTVSGEIVELVNAYVAYKTAFPDGEAYINLLPFEGASDSESVGKQRYEAYVRYYIDNIGKELGYVSYDHYPLNSSGLSTYHLWNLEIVASLCAEAGVEMRTFVKTASVVDSEYGKVATTCINDVAMQVYSNLAFGSKEIGYFTYSSHKDSASSPAKAIVHGITGETTELYDWVKTVNNNVQALAPAYLNFKWQSASYVKGTNQYVGTQVQADKLDNAISVGSYGTLKSVSSVYNALIGNFTDADGRYSCGARDGYMLVNYCDTARYGTSGTANFVLMFSGTSRALVYQDGASQVIDFTDGTLTLSLEPGMGAFIIPLV